MPVEVERANNERYNQQIYDLLREFAKDLEYRGWNNLTDWHTYAEDVMRAVLEPTFDYCLANANVSRANAAAFDLEGTDAAGERVLVQVSTDDSRGKVQGTLNKLGEDGASCHLRFMFLVEKHTAYKEDIPFVVPNGVRFDRQADVLDIRTLLGHIRHHGDPDRCKVVYERLCRELKVSRAVAGVVPQMLTSMPMLKRFIGRDQELADVQARLEQECIVPIRADGGVGKTALAAELVRRLKAARDQGAAEYRHLAWVRFSGTLAEDLLALRVPGSDAPLKEDRIRAVQQWLQTTNELTLLVIDNVEQIFSDEEEEILQGMSPYVRALITTRVELDLCEEYALRHLAGDRAAQVLYAYYLDRGQALTAEEMARRKDAEGAKEIVELTHGNTLLIELIAKAARSDGGGLVTFWSANKDKIFSNDAARIRTGHARSRSEGGLLTLQDQVTKLYALSRLTDEQRRIMSLLAQFPANAPIYYKLRDWAGFSQDDMNRLVELGWVERGEQSYVVHAVVRESVREQLRTQGEKVDPLEYGDLVDELADTRNYLSITEGYEVVRARIVLPETIVGLLKSAGHDELKLGRLCNDLGYVYNEQGDLASARRHHELALSIRERALGPDHPDTKLARSNLEFVLEEQAYGDASASSQG